jgi:hypothetical protein
MTLDDRALKVLNYLDNVSILTVGLLTFLFENQASIPSKLSSTYLNLGGVGYAALLVMIYNYCFGSVAYFISSWKFKYVLFWAFAGVITVTPFTWLFADSWKSIFVPVYLAIGLCHGIVWFYFVEKYWTDY